MKGDRKIWIVEFLTCCSESCCVAITKETVETWTADKRHKLDSKAPFIIMLPDDKQKLKLPKARALTLRHPCRHPNKHFTTLPKWLSKGFPIILIIFFLSLCSSARIWQHRWRVLAGSGKHLLADKPGNLQASHHTGRLVRKEGVCRVRQLQSGAWSWFLQTQSGPVSR